MTDSPALPFTIEPGDVLDAAPRAVLEEGAVFGVVPGDHQPHAVPLLTVAWLDEPPGVSLGQVVDEDLARLLSRPGSVLIDREAVLVGDADAVRTFALHADPAGLPTASEQWRLLVGSRRWTVSAMTALSDQPAWGPRLATAAASFRAAG